MSGSQFLVVRSVVPPASNYAAYRDYLRHDFWYSCAYCTITEVEARGVAFEIDHHLPRQRYPELVNNYDNLFWSCDYCNGKKKDLPSPGMEAKGLRFLRPDMDNWPDHFNVSGYSLVALTPIALFTETFLALNSNRLQRLRRARAELFKAREEILLGLRALAGTSIERIDRRVRAQFQSIRREMSLRADELEAEVDADIREWNRSLLIDQDPAERRADATMRQRFLAEVKAWPVSHIASATPMKTTNSAGGRKRGTPRKR